MAQLKGIEEFIWVLAIALILVAIFTAVTAIFPYNPAAVNETTGVTKNVVASFTQVGYVGYSSSYAGQSVNYGSFVVGQTQAENLKKATQLDICAGLWCNRQHELSVSVPLYYMDTLKGMSIKLAVYDTNQYGDLVVKWNGKEFYRSRPAARDYVVSIDRQYIKGSNILQIYAEGPGLMFWASTVYTLRDFSAELEYGPSVIKSFVLSQPELNAWNSGDLSFYGSGNTGQLRIRMNSNLVYQGMPSGQQSVALNFSNAGPKVGENLLVFDALGNGIFNLNGVQLRLYLMTNQVVKSKTFQLGASDYSKLSSGGSGIINFTVNSVQRDGDMTIKLNGKYLNVPKPAAGSNVVYFAEAEAAQGTNTMEMTGSGYWDIGEMTITI